MDLDDAHTLAIQGDWGGVGKVIGVRKMILRT
jgi:hypothetical protein